MPSLTPAQAEILRSQPPRDPVEILALMRSPQPWSINPRELALILLSFEQRLKALEAATPPKLLGHV